MNREEANEYAKGMSFRDAVDNVSRGRSIPYRKATLIKLYELLDLLDATEEEPKLNLSWIPDACRGCSNHPSNGGSGICHCTLGNLTIY